jgi:hypothetical protein
MTIYATCGGNSDGMVCSWRYHPINMGDHMSTTAEMVKVEAANYASQGTKSFNISRPSIRLPIERQHI